MTIDTATTLRDLAVSIPGATAIFEQHRMDYCCGGSATLAEACAARSIATASLVTALEGAAARAEPSDHARWGDAALTDLIALLVSKHHAYARDEMARLTPLLDKIARVHAEHHPEFAELRATFAALAGELEPHFMKEERVLFPYLDQAEAARAEGRPVPPAGFGSVANPIRRMSMEHDGAGELLRRLRAQSHDYTPPEDGCASVRAAFSGLAAFERDLHEHIHLENNVLFPRAIELFGA
jgi:regulator of cell morphogenesis and NO signaling